MLKQKYKKIKQHLYSIFSYLSLGKYNTQTLQGKQSEMVSCKRGVLSSMLP